MSPEIEGRPVLRPAGNVASAGIAIAKKSPNTPVKKPTPPTPIVKILKTSPPSSVSSTPRFPVSPQSARSPQKVTSGPRSPPSCTVTKASMSPGDVPHNHSLIVAKSRVRKATTSPKSPPSFSLSNSLSFPGDIQHMKMAFPSPKSPSLCSVSKLIDTNLTNITSSNFLNACNSHAPVKANPHPDKSLYAGTGSSQKSNPLFSVKKSITLLEQKKTSLVVAEDTFVKEQHADFVPTKKIPAHGLYAPQNFKAATGGWKHGKVSRVVPEMGALSPVLVEPKRCKFITDQTDPLHVAYHDDEWGRPVHDDRMLFELLVLCGSQVELSWATILHRRLSYRDAFFDFNVAAVASLTEKEIHLLETNKSLMLPKYKILGIVENARCILEIVQEYGSFDKYLWGCINYKPMINHHQNPQQVPVKTSKSESISKDLVKRGFRFVGPSIIYSFMQCAGMVNDHLVQCFRHQQCAEFLLSHPDKKQDKRLCWG